LPADARAGDDQTFLVSARGVTAGLRRVVSMRLRDRGTPLFTSPGRTGGATSIERGVRDAAYAGPRTGRVVRETAAGIGDARRTVNADADTPSGPCTAARTLTRE
jgi:hypothetical protein